MAECFSRVSRLYAAFSRGNFLARQLEGILYLLVNRSGSGTLYSGEFRENRLRRSGWAGDSMGELYFDSNLEYTSVDCLYRSPVRWTYSV